MPRIAAAKQQYIGDGLVNWHLLDQKLRGSVANYIVRYKVFVRIDSMDVKAASVEMQS